MQEPLSKCAISRQQYDAVLLDLDGVITDTASLHAACWKQMFDEYLKERATKRGEPFQPFDLSKDYRLYVDGKPRYNGVRDFLKSRGIELPEGSPHDPPDAETVTGLGNRKNDLVNNHIEDIGVEPYGGSVKLIEQLRDEGFKIAVVTSSQNCTAVPATGLPLPASVTLPRTSTPRGRAIVASCLVKRLMTAIPIRTRVIRPRPSGISTPKTRKLSGTRYSRSPGWV